MSRYDGLIIPRSYSEYINKTDAATLQQALQLPGVLSGAVAAGDNKAVKSSAVNNALANYVSKSFCNCIVFNSSYTQRQVFYELKDHGVLITDDNEALAYVIGNLNGTPFNNIYQKNGTRYFRQDNTIIGGVTWNSDDVINSEIRILYVKDIV